MFLFIYENWSLKGSPNFVCLQDSDSTFLFSSQFSGDNVFFFVFLVFFFAVSWATPAAYGSSQARGRIGAVASGLHQSHSNVGSEPCLQLTPQLTAMPDR